MTIRQHPRAQDPHQGATITTSSPMSTRDIYYIGEPGDVLVGDAGGMTEMSSMGGQSFVSAKIRGLEA